MLLIISFVAVLGASENYEALRSKIVPNGTVLLVYVGVVIIACIVLLVLGLLFILDHMVREELVVTDVYRYKPTETNQGFAKNYRVYFKK